MWSANVETVVSSEQVVQASIEVAKKEGYLIENQPKQTESE